MDEKEFEKTVDEKIDALFKFKPQNRAQKRAQNRAIKKATNGAIKDANDFKEQIKKAAYVDLIQKLRAKYSEKKDEDKTNENDE